MPECDDCGTGVHHVWRRRDPDDHGEAVRWVCPTCHPELSDELTVELDREGPIAGNGADSTGAKKREIRSDGGVVAAAGTPDRTESPERTGDGRFDCPVCSGETINGQGLYDCLDCGWTGPQ